MISPQVIEEIKYRNDIETVIGAHVRLKRAGARMVGLCPFHSEKTPSFTVFTENRSFYCFGCGAGGDVISFVMRIENLDYKEALRYLADRAGIPLPEDDRETGYETGVRRERILEMNREAARFFHDNLKKSPEAQAYLTKRALSPALVRHFGIGFAPNDFSALTKHLSGKGFTPNEMAAGFLCSVSKKNGRSYDIFRNRLMFPIIDVRGEIVAFGGRTIGNDPNEAKYINTSDTPAFIKRRNLFALNFAKGDCAEQLILCEGYMDVVSLHGAGFTNAVASCGTALTPDQARLMRRYTKSVVISYDADEAGQRAADKAFSLLGEAGLETRLLKVENAKDPDEYIKKFGKEAFARLLTKSQSRFDFKMAGILSKYRVEDPDDRVKAAAATAEMLAGVWSEVERDVYIKRAAEVLSVTPDSLKSDVRRLVARKEKTDRGQRFRAVVQEAEGFGDRVNPDRMRNLGAAGAEEAILGVLSLYPELIPKAVGGELALTEDDFATAFNRRVFAEMKALGADFDIGRLGGEFSQEEISRIVRYGVSRRDLTKNDLSVVAACTERLRSLREDKALSLEELIAKKRSRET